MTALIGWSLLLGLGLGLGAVLFMSGLRPFGAQPLAERVAPFVMDVSAEARALVAAHKSVSQPLLALLLGLLPSGLKSWWRGAGESGETIRHQLHQLGSKMALQTFRLRQLFVGFGGLGLGAALVALHPQLRTLPLIALLALPLILAFVATLAFEKGLSLAAARQVRFVENELAVTLDFLALCLSAGTGVTEALERASRNGSGVLMRRLRLALAETHSGVPLANTLRAVARELAIPALTRTIEVLVAALEQGAPIARVLEAQASQTRQQAKRNLLELAGKKEIQMLVPLVFLILPVTILFAIFPGLFVLQTGFIQ